MSYTESAVIALLIFAVIMVFYASPMTEGPNDEHSADQSNESDA